MFDFVPENFLRSMNFAALALAVFHAVHASQSIRKPNLTAGCFIQSAKHDHRSEKQSRFDFPHQWSIDDPVEWAFVVIDELLSCLSVVDFKNSGFLMSTPEVFPLVLALETLL